jgi:hypothetical protein
MGTGKILASFFRNTALGRGDGDEAATWQGARAQGTDARSIAVSASEGWNAIRVSRTVAVE